MKSFKKIFLVGFMGSGKSTHARKLASAIGYALIDLDDLIEKKEGLSVQELFSRKGENHFRELETKYLEEILQQDNAVVVSLGGGTVCFHDNMRKVLNTGLVIYIKMPAEALYQRLVNSKKDRPLLKNKTGEELSAYVNEMLDKRSEFYERAHILVNGIDLTAAKLKEEVSLFSANH